MTSETVHSLEDVVIGKKEIHALQFVAAKFRQKFTDQYFFDSGLVPSPETDNESPVMYLTLFSETEALMPSEGTGESIPVLFPLDIRKANESSNQLITLVRQVKGEALLTQFGHLAANEPHFLGVANIAHALSPEFPTTVFMEKPDKISMRTVSMRRTDSARAFMSELEAKPEWLGKNIVVAKSDEAEKTFRLLLDDGAWKGSNVFTDNQSEVFKDPGYSISIPVYIEGRRFIFQIGLVLPPEDRVSEEFYSRIDEIRRDAQELLEESWNEAERVLYQFDTTGDEPLTIKIGFLKDAFAVTQGNLELLRTIIKAGVFDPRTVDMMDILVEQALNGAKSERRATINLIKSFIEGDSKNLLELIDREE